MFEISGAMKVDIYKRLSIHQKQHILMLTGIECGDCEYASKDFVGFWTTLLAKLVKIDDFLSVWKSYPVLHEIFREYFNNLKNTTTNPTTNLTTNPITNPTTNLTTNPITNPTTISITNPATNSTTNSSTPTITTASTGSLIANAFKKVKSEKETTVRDFFEATDGVNGTHAMKLQLALDASGNWEMILHDLGLTTGPEIAAEIQKRHQQWTQHGESPTKKLIADLIDTEWGDQTMSEFVQYLRSKDNTEITAIVDSWTNQVYGKMVKAAEIGAKKFTSAKNLITFFEPLIDEEDQLFNPENIQVFVNKLQNDGINTVSLMQKLSGDVFKEYGMNRGQIIKFESALKEFEASKKTE
jgi:hypothetical protein